jgi:hypothetical protein
MKNLRVWLVSAVLGGGLATIQSQPALEVSERVRVFSAPVATGPAAVVVTAKGKVEVSSDGIHFAAVKPQQIVTEGMTVKTGGDGQTDIFFRRTGVALRLREKGELKLTKMEQTSTEGAVKTATAVDLERGRAMALTRGPFTGPFEIKSAKGIKVAPTKAGGRHVISAGNSKGRKSIDLASLPVLAQGSAAMREKGKGGRGEEAVSGYLEIDELQALAEEWSGETETETPVKKD